MKDYDNSEIEALIDEHIHNKKHRAILKSRLRDGLIFDELAEEYHYSVRQVKRIVYKGLEKLCPYL